MNIKQCSCGSTDFEIEVDDQVVKICCTGCDTVYFYDEMADLPDRYRPDITDQTDNKSQI